jgi:hypothetical protein
MLTVRREKFPKSCMSKGELHEKGIGNTCTWVLKNRINYSCRYFKKGRG